MTTEPTVTLDVALLAEVAVLRAAVAAMARHLDLELTGFESRMSGSYERALTIAEVAAMIGPVAAEVSARVGAQVAVGALNGLVRAGAAGTVVYAPTHQVRIDTPPTRKVVEHDDRGRIVAITETSI